MMRAWALGVSLVAVTLAVPGAQSSSDGTLNMYVIDVEGGNATLLVAPGGESMLIDTGNGGAAATRDVGRIMAAVHDAGLDRLTYLVTTHWHGDHFGGMAELASRIPIANFVDHGANVQPNANTDRFLADTYPGLYARSTHRVVVPGDRLPMTDVDVRVVASGGEVLSAPLTGAGQPNPFCADFTPQAEDTSENAQSVGSHVTFGRFRALHLGDLTVNKEFALLCPTNRLGTVDLFVVSHHGQPSSNAQVLVHAIAPRAAIMNNGTRKGGQPEAMRVLFSAPGLEDLWQVHFSQLSGQEYTVPGLFIANPIDDEPPTMPIAAIAAPGRGANAPPPPAHDGTAYWIKVAARRDGSFTITNARNGFSKAYHPAPAAR